jgi:hypothetical protein
MENWKKELEDIFLSDSLASRAERENARFSQFLREVVTPALNEVAGEMRRLGRTASVREAPASTILTVYRNNGAVEEICYSVTRRFINDGILPEAHARVVRTNARATTHEEPFRPEGTQYTIDDVTSEDIIRSFLTFYRMTKGQ